MRLWRKSEHLFDTEVCTATRSSRWRHNAVLSILTGTTACLVMANHILPT